MNGYKTAVSYKLKSMGDILVAPIPHGKHLAIFSCTGYNKSRH
ncbi:hypothetical protein CZ787_08105 [Halomonas citrativorans]|uniref:Uncharacterized protein n=1 Tax=Halomonas citrativorans TaxID=2742612 RepID=A0A1R4HZ88_9GAMM|nr:hypothetical protein CZ787_08105 [Halomonas citrativorans]